jgi:hypothetical protein
MTQYFKFFLILALLIGTSSVCEAKTKKALPVKSEEQIQTEAALAEVQAKFIEEQPGYIAELGVFDAEMQNALALYQTSHSEAGKVHLSHADVIIYKRLLNRVLARRAVGFSGELSAFIKGINGGESFKSLKLKHDKLRLAISASRGKGDLISVVPMLTAVNLLMHKSADYFNSGVANGAVVDAGQYQDSWGFMKAAKTILADISKKERANYSGAFAEIDDALADLNKLWPSLTANETNSDGPQILSDAAAKIEEKLAIITQP